MPRQRCSSISLSGITTARDCWPIRGCYETKDRVAGRYQKGTTFNKMNVMLPWHIRPIGNNCTLLGGDWWPYGIERKRAAMDAILRYHHEQGLTRQRFAIEDAFLSGLLDT